MPKLHKKALIAGWTLAISLLAGVAAAQSELV
jgi:hypothetical protein